MCSSNLWISLNFAKQFGNQIVGFVVSMILARILMPEEIGLIGMIAIFIANYLINSSPRQSFSIM